VSAHYGAAANRRRQSTDFFLSDLLQADPVLLGSPLVALDAFDWPYLRRRLNGILISDDIERPFRSFGGHLFTHDFRIIVAN